MRIFPLLKDSLDDLRLFVYIKKSSVSSFVLQWGYLWSDDLPNPPQVSSLPCQQSHNPSDAYFPLAPNSHALQHSGTASAKEVKVTSN